MGGFTCEVVKDGEREEAEEEERLEEGEMKGKKCSAYFELKRACGLSAQARGRNTLNILQFIMAAPPAQIIYRAGSCTRSPPRPRRGRTHARARACCPKSAQSRRRRCRRTGAPAWGRAAAC